MVGATSFLSSYVIAMLNLQKSELKPVEEMLM